MTRMCINVAFLMQWPDHVKEGGCKHAATKVCLQGVTASPHVGDASCSSEALPADLPIAVHKPVSRAVWVTSLHHKPVCTLDLQAGRPGVVKGA
jgi:hypothetical protein